MTVNLEAFLLLNAGMNALALICAARLSSLRLRAARAALASACGAAYAVMAYLPGLEALQGGLRLLAPLAMGALAFAPARPSAMARGCAWLCGCTFLLGGTGMGMMGVWGMRGYTLPPILVTLFIGGAAAFALRGAVKRARLAKATADVCIRAFGASARIKGIVDTGNCLVEPLSGLPVLVISGGCLNIDVQAAERAARPVAYRSIGGGGILSAFMPDSLTLDGMRVDNAYIAITNGSIDGRYDALIPGALMRKKVKMKEGERYELG